MSGGFPGGSVVQNRPANAGDARDKGLIPGSGRSPGEGRGNPLQCSCLGNPMDRGAWRATVQGVGYDFAAEQPQQRPAMRNGAVLCSTVAELPPGVHPGRNRHPRALLSLPGHQMKKNISTQRHPSFLLRHGSPNSTEQCRRGKMSQ